MNEFVHPRTSNPNKAQKFQSKKACLDALSWLSKTFPEAFDTEFRVRPLKVGIMADILQYVEENNITDVSKSKLRQAVVMFTRRMEYLVCVKAREDRIDLSGKAVEAVSAEDANRAANRIRERMDKMVREKQQPAKTTIKTETEYPMSSAAPQVATETRTTTEVMVKRKSTRRFDPEAVARLKAKLKIANKEKETA